MPCCAAFSMRAIPELRATVAGIAKAHGSKPRRQAAPLLAVAALPIAGVCGGDLRGERDSALILLGFADAFAPLRAHRDPGRRPAFL